MRVSYRLGVLLAAICLLSMTSCIDSEKPLSDPEQAQPVKELLGLWRERHDDGSIRYYHVGRAASSETFPGGLMRMAIVDHEKDGGVNVIEDRFFFFTTKLGDRHFLNITVLETDQLSEIAKSGWKPAMFKGYWIYEYKLSGDKVRLLMMDQEQKKSLIESKKLKGVIKSDQISFQVSTEDLVKLITSPDAAKLFQPAGKEELERVK